MRNNVIFICIGFCILITVLGYLKSTHFRVKRLKHSYVSNKSSFNRYRDIEWELCYKFGFCINKISYQSSDDWLDISFAECGSNMDMSPIARLNFKNGDLIRISNMIDSTAYLPNSKLVASKLNNIRLCENKIQEAVKIVIDINSDFVEYFPDSELFFSFGEQIFNSGSKGRGGIKLGQRAPNYLHREVRVDSDVYICDHISMSHFWRNRN